MKPSTKRLASVAALTFIVSLVGAVLAIVFQWPTQFDGSGTANVTAEEFIAGGTATSIPLVPWAALGVFALLARSRRWWGTLAVMGLCLLGPLFVIGGMGEAFAPATLHVPRAVLVISGAVYVLLGMTLFLSGVFDLIGRWRSRRSAEGRAGYIRAG
jgi:hypothetical protein